MSSPIQPPSSSFRKSKGHKETIKRRKARLRTQHIDVEGTVDITFTPDGLLIHESISWDGEKDVTRVVLLPADPVEEGSSGRGDGGARVEGKGEVDEGAQERDVDMEGPGGGEERSVDYQASAAARAS